MKYLNSNQKKTRDFSNLPKDLDELVKDFKRKKNKNNDIISNLPNKLSLRIESISNKLENYTTEKINKVSFIKKYNEIMKEIDIDNILIHPKYVPGEENIKHLENLNFNKFIRGEIERNSPLKNIKKDMLKTNIEDFTFDNLYMDPKNFVSLARLKKNIDFKSYNINKSNISKESSDVSLTKSNINTLNFEKSTIAKEKNIYRRSLSLNNLSNIEKTEKNINEKNGNSILNTIKNEFFHISNVLSYSNFHNKNKTISQKETIKNNNNVSDQINQSNINHINNSFKNSNNKTFYSTLPKTPNSKKRLNNIECLSSNFSPVDLSPDSRNNANKSKNSIFKTYGSNFYRKNTNGTNISNDEGKIKYKKNLFIERYRDLNVNLNLNCYEKFADKVSRSNISIESPEKKRNSYCDGNRSTIDVNNKSANMQNLEDIFKQKNERNLFSSGFFKKNDQFQKYSLDILSENNEEAEDDKIIFKKLNSYDLSKTPVKKKLIKENLKHFHNKKNIGFISNIDRDKNLNLDKNSPLKKSNRNDIHINSTEKTKDVNVIYGSNFEIGKTKDIPISFKLIRDQPCKQNKFNNFQHLREEIYTDKTKFKKEILFERKTVEKNNYFNSNRYKGNFNSVDITFNSGNAFLNKPSIINKLEATKRLKLTK